MNFFSNVLYVFDLLWFSGNYVGGSHKLVCYEHKPYLLVNKKNYQAGSIHRGFGKPRSMLAHARRSKSYFSSASTPSPSFNEGDLVNDEQIQQNLENGESGLPSNAQNENVTIATQEAQSLEDLTTNEKENLTPEEERAVASFLKGEKLSKKQLQLLSIKGPTFWVELKRNNDKQKVGVDIVNFPLDTVFKVIFYLRDENSRVVPAFLENKITKKKISKEKSYTVKLTDTESLATETVSFTMLFTVINNNFTCNFKDLINKLKNLIWTEHLAELYPDSCKLETIKIEKVYPLDNVEVQKKRTYKFYGKIDQATMKSTNSPFAIVLSSDFVQASRNDHQIRFSKLAVPEGIPLKEYEKNGSFSKRLEVFCEALEKPIQISDGLVVMLTLETEKKGMPSRYWTVDNVLPLGFLTPNKIYKLKESGNPLMTSLSDSEGGDEA